MKSIAKTLTISAGVALALALGACDKKEAPKPAAAKPQGGSQLLMGKEAPKQAQKPTADLDPNAPVPGPTRPAPPAPAAPVVSVVPMDDSSAEAALKTWLGRLQAGDLRGAVEVCDPSAPGRAKIENLANRMDMIRADPTAGETLASNALMMLTGELKQITYTTKSADPMVSVFELLKGEKKIDVQVGKLGDVWRVVPPSEGLPQ